MKSIKKILLSALMVVFCLGLFIGITSAFDKPQKASATGEIDVLKTARITSLDNDYVLFVTAFDIDAAKAQGADTLVYTINDREYTTDTYYSAVALKTDKNDATVTRTFVASDIYKDEKYANYMLAVLELENDVAATNTYEVYLTIRCGSDTVAAGEKIRATVAATESTMVIGSVSASAGGEVDVTIRLENNPGVSGIQLDIDFDDALTLTSVTAGTAFSALTFTKPGNFAAPCTFLWDSAGATAVNDGVLLTLHFTVSDQATPGSVLNITCDDQLFTDENYDDVIFDIVDGAIFVK